MGKTRSKTITGFVLKYVKTGEADKIVTLVSQDFGKQVAVAKSSRKLKSHQKGFLEPGSVIKTHLIITKGLPILSQTELLADTHCIQHSLSKMRQLQQVLEIYNRLLVEEELEPELFELLLAIRNTIVSKQPTSSRVMDLFEQLLMVLGYQPLAETTHQNLTSYITALTEKPLNSWDFMSL